MTEMTAHVGPMPELSTSEEQRVHAYISAIAARSPAERRDFESGRLGARFAMLYEVVSTGDYRRSGNEAVASALRQL
jgi:hypothetical protein